MPKIYKGFRNIKTFNDNKKYTGRESETTTSTFMKSLINSPRNENNQMSHQNKLISFLGNPNQSQQNQLYPETPNIMQQEMYPIDTNQNMGMQNMGMQNMGMQNMGMPNQFYSGEPDLMLNQNSAMTTPMINQMYQGIQAPEKNIQIEQLQNMVMNQTQPNVNNKILSQAQPSNNNNLSLLLNNLNNNNMNFSNLAKL